MRCALHTPNTNTSWTDRILIAPGKFWPTFWKSGNINNCMKFVFETKRNQWKKFTIVGEVKKNATVSIVWYNLILFNVLVLAKADGPLVFACRQCLALFGEQRDRNRHELLVHGKPSPEQRFGCKKCNVVFFKLTNLYHHMKNIHAVPTSSEQQR